MATSDDVPVSFTETETRTDEMHRHIDQWLADLTEHVEAAKASEEFRAWLDVQSRFVRYSPRNTLLIRMQRPEASRVAGYRTWQEEFGRHVRKGESAIWIWAPLIARRCPACENSKTYHDRSDCSYDETPADEWKRGLVGFKPVPVFDVSQTEGEELPELDTGASGMVDGLVDELLKAAQSLGASVELVPGDRWPHGEARGICRWTNTPDERPIIEVVADRSDAAVAKTLVHEYAHALLHVDEVDERAKREVEAEAVAYVVGRHLGLDPHGSAFYLASWSAESATTIEARLGRISDTAARIIEAVE